MFQDARRKPRGRLTNHGSAASTRGPPAAAPGEPHDDRRARANSWQRSGSLRPSCMVIGTTSGGMSFGEQFYRAQRGASARPRWRATWLANYMPQKPVLDAAAACGWTAPSQIIANACASGTNAIGHAFQLIRAGQCISACLCGGYDADFGDGFRRLRFAPGFDAGKDPPFRQAPHRPRARRRRGAARAGGMRKRAPRAARRSSRRSPATASPRTTITSPSRIPSGIGPRLAMERALADARRTPAEVDYINAHGTATTFNDATEGTAIAQLFGARVPVSSTKSMMGHALGAAGAIEAVFSMLALRGQFLPPNIHFRELDPAWTLDVVANTARPARVRCVRLEFVRLRRNEREPRAGGVSPRMSARHRRPRLGDAAGRRAGRSLGAHSRAATSREAKLAHESGDRAGALLSCPCRRRWWRSSGAIRACAAPARSATSPSPPGLRRSNMRARQ